LTSKREKKIIIFIIRRGRKSETKRGRSDIVRARRRILVQTPTDSEQKSSASNSFKGEKEIKKERKKITSN
jgi:hypothetical protein